MGDVREIPSGETHLAAAALLELRPQYDTPDSIVSRVDDLREGGYRVVGSFEGGEEETAAVAGFHVAEMLQWGRYVYVDDLVTRASLRGRGHASAALAWVAEEARREGCGQLHLDTGLGPERFDAHRFYYSHGLVITSHHFARRLG